MQPVGVQKTRHFALVECQKLFAARHRDKMLAHEAIGRLDSRREIMEGGEAANAERIARAQIRAQKLGTLIAENFKLQKIA